MKKIINKKDNTICIEGNIAGHNTKPFYGHIIINGTIIKKVSKGKYKKTPDYIYNKDCIIYPGMGDIHIHAREDDTAKQVYKEDYTTSADAAMNGGVTFVSAMPNTPNPLTDTKRLS
ncbi:MAG: amidohydrolase family protein [Cyanobium sp. MAG06]|nr:amidohydrolase family protein [Cyanobium sp. MAG06]